jgi:hypothetical protein
MRKHFTMVKVKDYDQMKTLLKVGLNMAKVMEVTGRSYNTVSDVNKTTDFNDYRTTRHNGYLAWLAKKNGVNKKTAPLFSETVLSKKPVTKADDQTIALLERIANALELMEGHWRPMADKKRFRIF